MQIDYALCRPQIADAPHAQWQKFCAIRTHSLSFIMPTICITLVLLGPKVVIRLSVNRLPVKLPITGFNFQLPITDLPTFFFT